MTRIALLSLALFISSAAHAIDNGQWGDVDPVLRDWFKQVRPPNGGVPCCDLADGHPVDAEVREDDRWWAYFEGEWRQVPEDKVVVTPNPMGRAIIWYYLSGNDANGVPQYMIRCFVPVAGA